MRYTNRHFTYLLTYSVGAEAPSAAELTSPDRNIAVGSHGE